MPELRLLSGSNQAQMPKIPLVQVRASINRLALCNPAPKGAPYRRIQMSQEQPRFQLIRAPREDFLSQLTGKVLFEPFPPYVTSQKR
jgi:hypothetical protein